MSAETWLVRLVALLFCPGHNDDYLYGNGDFSIYLYGDGYYDDDSFRHCPKWMLFFWHLCFSNCYLDAVQTFQMMDADDDLFFCFNKIYQLNITLQIVNWVLNYDEGTSGTDAPFSYTPWRGFSPS